jgi:hypothetical protein
MSCSRSTRVVSRVFDAVLRPESWPLALEAVTETACAIGAAYIVRSKETARVEWIRLSVPSVALDANYAFHYASIDGFSPSIDASAQRRRLKLSKCFPKNRLRSDEWYNDFVVKAGRRHAGSAARRPSVPYCDSRHPLQYATLYAARVRRRPRCTAQRTLRSAQQSGTTAVRVRGFALEIFTGAARARSTHGWNDSHGLPRAAHRNEPGP